MALNPSEVLSKGRLVKLHGVARQQALLAISAQDKEKGKWREWRGSNP
jgi:hypothetical protein